VGKDWSDYVQVRETYIAENGETIPRGEILHRNHPLTNHALCDPVNIRHDVEQATAAPGEKRAAKVTKSKDEDEDE
jgi:hypothetical protein